VSQPQPLALLPSKEDWIAKLTTQYHVSLYFTIKPGNLFSIPVRGKESLFSAKVQMALGPTSHPVPWVPGSTSQAVKRQGCEADNFHPITRLRISRAIPPPLYAILTYRGVILFFILLSLFSDFFELHMS
jgi:hypothetical protein